MSSRINGQCDNYILCVCVTLNHDCPFLVLVHFSNAILCLVSTSIFI